MQGQSARMFRFDVATGKARGADGASEGIGEEDEVSDLIKAARKVGRNRLRDATLILLSYRHGLRVT